MTKLKNIDKKITIQEVIKLYPGAENILFEQGMHCTKCHMAGSETLEQGLKSHGLDDDKIKDLSDKLQKGYSYYQKNCEQYGISVTKGALKKIKQIQKEENKEKECLKITFEKDEWGGISYSMDFVKNTNKNEQQITIDNVCFVINKSDKKDLQGVEIDYIINDFTEGFSILRA